MENISNLKIIKFCEEFRKETIECVLLSYGSGKSWDHECDYFKAERLNDKLLDNYLCSRNTQIFLLISMDQNKNNKLIGTIQLTLYNSYAWAPPEFEAEIKDTGFFMISLLSILPEFQSRGLGKLLMNFCEVYAYACKYNSLDVDNFILEHINKKFNYVINLKEEEFFLNNLEDLKKVKKIAVQFNESRNSLKKFYEKKGYIYSGHYIRPRKDTKYPITIFKEFHWVIHWKNVDSIIY